MADTAKERIGQYVEIGTDKPCCVCGRRIAPGSYYEPKPEPRHYGCGYPGFFLRSWRMETRDDG